MSRFDYIKYDAGAEADQVSAKILVKRVEKFIESIGYAQGKLSPQTARSKALAITKLEECYAWIGKAIRDDQIARGVAPLQEERTNS